MAASRTRKVWGAVSTEGWSSDRPQHFDRTKFEYHDTWMELSSSDGWSLKEVARVDFKDPQRPSTWAHFIWEKPIPKPLPKPCKRVLTNSCGFLTQRGVYEEAANRVGLTGTKVQDIIETVLRLSMQEAKRHGKFKLAKFFQFDVKKTNAQPGRHGKHPVTGRPCNIRARPAGKKVRVKALSRFLRPQDLS